LPGALDEYLPNKPYLMERFDGLNRVKQYFFALSVNRAALEGFFDTDQTDVIARQLLKLKESHLLHSIQQLSASDIISLYAKNLLIALDLLQDRGYRLGIVSSTCESVILSMLGACNVTEAFDFIIGEESLIDKQGVLHDKPHPYAASKIPARFKSDDACYIGDDVRIDSAFARNSGFRFVQAYAGADFVKLCTLL
jgi:phosphoglycolate phosphatase-like HAD superfamily hydrolase